MDQLRSLFSFEETREAPPISSSQVRAPLLASQTGPLETPGGTFTAKAADRITELLASIEKDLADTIVRWRAGFAAKPRGSSATIFEQRDATVMLFRIAGLRAPLTDPDSSSWEVQEFQRTYLTERPREDLAIVADAFSFLGWEKEEMDGWGAQTFTDGAGTSLSIVNINRQPSESRTGADLVYYHHQRRCLVHVQYKRMLRSDEGSPGRPWIYDEDAHFRFQLDALLMLDRLLAERGKSSRDYRLSPESGYFKFTMMDDYGTGDAALVPGHYMSASFLDIARGGRDGRLGRLRSDDRSLTYLTNTLFADLVGYGLIGSRGVDLVDVREILASLARAKESVVLGLHSESEPNRRFRERDARPVGSLDLSALGVPPSDTSAHSSD